MPPALTVAVKVKIVPAATEVTGPDEEDMPRMVVVATAAA
jgi:hypothetical protein